MSEDKIKSADVVLALEKSEDEVAQLKAVARKLKVPPKAISEIRLRKQSIDARKPQIKVQLRFDVALNDESLPPEPDYTANYPQVPDKAKTVVIIGSGPAGLFAALRCIERGWKPIILERGKDASARRFDLRPILNDGVLDEESNYCFGEGGAGTFSDGKLYTRIGKRREIQTIYETFVAHGAPKQILIDAHPHIGSNLLPKVVQAIRESILKAGGEVRFHSKVTDFVISGNRIHSVIVNGSDEISGDAFILATGHSARDIYHRLNDLGVLMEQKPFAVGVRIEHPQSLIDGLQYHLPKGENRPELLPAASYHLATKFDGRGVHSFCMCPGGFIVPAATANDEVVVNGMSLSQRDSPFANSGIVVTVEAEDCESFAKEHGVLAGMAFQRSLETAAKIAGGGGQSAPGQRVLDFLGRKDSADLPNSSYRPGVNPARLDEILPDWIGSKLSRGLRLFGKWMNGYLSGESNLVGFETRTSSPVRIPRDPETLQHPEVDGLFPCGEGAGYAGGIVSAALDGIRCADAL